jgi:hypothetical protein
VCEHESVDAVKAADMAFEAAQQVFVVELPDLLKELFKVRHAQSVHPDFAALGVPP